MLFSFNRGSPEVSQIAQLFAYACVLAAAMILGNWFLSELHRARAQGRPWYYVYFFSTPGQLILVALFILPVFFYFL